MTTNVIAATIAASASTRINNTGTRDAPDPVEDAVQPIAEPVQWLAKRSRSGRGSVLPAGENVLCGVPRLVGIDGCGDPGGKRDAHCAIAICTSNASSRIRRSK